MLLFQCGRLRERMRPCWPLRQRLRYCGRRDIYLNNVTHKGGAISAIMYQAWRARYTLLPRLGHLPPHAPRIVLALSA